MFGAAAEVYWLVCVMFVHVVCLSFGGCLSSVHIVQLYLG